EDRLTLRFQAHGPSRQQTVVRVWDVPVRVAHWLLVLLVALSWISAERGWLHWHKILGDATLSLIIFRVYWGLCVSETARFAHFLRGPKAVLRYARTMGRVNRPHSDLGHNPLGGWNVIALLVVLFVQSGSGI